MRGSRGYLHVAGPADLDVVAVHLDDDLLPGDGYACDPQLADPLMTLDTTAVDARS